MIKGINTNSDQSFDKVYESTQGDYCYSKEDEDSRNNSQIEIKSEIKLSFNSSVKSNEKSPSYTASTLSNNSNDSNNSNISNSNNSNELKKPQLANSNSSKK